MPDYQQIHLRPRQLGAGGGGAASPLVVMSQSQVLNVVRLADMPVD